MLPGEYIKKMTTALGVKPCRGCQKRAEKLNEWGRRGFLKTGTLALLGLKNSTLRLAWQAVGKELPVGVPEAIAFIRQFNTVQAAFQLGNQRHATLEEVWARFIHHKAHFKPGTLGYAWASRYNPFSQEVLPGWFLDFVIITQGYPKEPLDQEKLYTGFRLVLRGERYCLISDETTIIYQAYTPHVVPAAASLPDAKSFPGAVAYNLFTEKLSWLQRLSDFLVPTVYACACTCNSQCVSCCNNPSIGQVGCEVCIVACCQTVTCGDVAPNHQCFCAIGCTGPDGTVLCRYISSACSTPDCTDCGRSYFGVCCCAVGCVDENCQGTP